MPKVTVTVKTTIKLIRRARRAAERIRVKVERINQVRDQINQRRQQLQAIRDRIDRLRTNPITNAWRETAEGAIFVQNMERATRDLEAMIGVVQRLGTALQDSANRFQDAQQRAVNAANALRNARNR